MCLSKIELSRDRNISSRYHERGEIHEFLCVDTNQARLILKEVKVFQQLWHSWQVLYTVKRSAVFSWWSQDVHVLLIVVELSLAGLRETDSCICTVGDIPFKVRQSVGWLGYYITDRHN